MDNCKDFCTWNDIENGYLMQIKMTNRLHYNQLEWINNILKDGII